MGKKGSEDVASFQKYMTCNVGKGLVKAEGVVYCHI